MLDRLKHRFLSVFSTIVLAEGLPATGRLPGGRVYVGFTSISRDYMVPYRDLIGFV